MPDKWIASASNEAELRSAIVAFEQILEAEPNDRLALETLSDAYERMGDQTKASLYLVRLAEVITLENDVKTAPELMRRLRAFGDSPEIAQAQRKLQELQHAGPSSQRMDSGRETAPMRRAIDITREVSLAWDLLQAEEISQEDYAGIVHDLSENSTKLLESPITVLHALQDRSFANLDKVVAFLARSSGKPLISLAHFELQYEIANLLPADFMAHRGAIAFEKIGRDLLVAVLNPFDTDLQEDVRRITDRRCHFCLCTAAEYDSALAAIRKFQSAVA